MFKILFIYPSLGQLKTFNAGIGSLSAVLKEFGFDVQLIETDSSRISPVIRRIHHSNPNVIGISCFSNAWPYANKLIKQIKSRYPYLKIFVGGPHSTLFPEVIEQNAALDGICIGEGEYPLLELLQSLSAGRDYASCRGFWIRKHGTIYRNPLAPLPDLNKLPLPDRSIFEKQSILNYPNFMFSRGCLFNCAYCCNNKFNRLYEDKRKVIRFRSVDNAILELKDFLKYYATKLLLFDDDSFNKNRHWFAEFCEKYPKEIGIPFACNTRPELLNNESATMLKMAGCQVVSIGIECGNETLRRTVLKRQMTNEKIISAFQCARAAGLKTSAFNMVGIPGETKKSFRDTIRLNQVVQPDHIQITIYYPYLGTELGDYCRDQGYITNRDTTSYFSDSTLNLPGFSRAEIRNCFRTFKYKVYGQTSIKKALFGFVEDFLMLHPRLRYLAKKAHSYVQ